LLVFGLVFLVFCFVGGGLLPLLEVASPERPDKSMAKGKAVVDSVMIRNETKAKEPNAKGSQRRRNAMLPNETKPGKLDAKVCMNRSPGWRGREGIVTKEDESATIRNDAVENEIECGKA
jgi:hypothetical protein